MDGSVWTGLPSGLAVIGRARRDNVSRLSNSLSIADYAAQLGWRAYISHIGCVHAAQGSAPDRT
jgi:hypothetical protein